MLKAYREFQLFDRGYPIVAGVDEVGRGAWAGPLVAAAIVVMDQRKIKLPIKTQRLVNDSKKLVAPKREELAALLKEQSLAWAVAEVSVEDLDKLGLGEANKLALRQALDKLGLFVDYYLADYLAGFKHSQFKGEVIKQGDGKILSIAAASVVAKVWRDALLSRLDKAWPGYGFANHAGYGTKEHQRALKKLGPSPIHRKSFTPIKNLLD